MSDFTPRANLRLPGGGSTGTILPDEQVDIDVLNDNFRKIDALLGARNIPSASSYAGSMDGDLVYARDTEFLHMFSTTAGGLITPRLPGARQYSGTAAERVAFAVQAKNGDLWRDTDNIGVIWAYKAGSPGAWEYTGNALRGTKAAMDQLVTDGKAVVGMKCYNTNDSSEYVFRDSKWKHDGVGLIPIRPTSVSSPGGTNSIRGLGAVDVVMATGVQLNGVFSDEFDSYILRYQILAATSATYANLSARFCKSGVPDASTNYYRSGVGISGGGTASSTGSATVVNELMVGAASQSWFPDEGTVHITGPGRDDRRSHLNATGMGTISNQAFSAFNLAGVLNKNDVMDGIEIRPSNGSFSGTFQVFGYAV